MNTALMYSTYHFLEVLGKTWENFRPAAALWADNMVTNSKGKGGLQTIPLQQKYQRCEDKRAFMIKPKGKLSQY
jgi:hypothetical protein